VLGRLQPDFALGGSLTLDVASAKNAMQQLATQLGLGMEETAEGVLALANEHMTQALRVISIQKGFDPADFALLSFGGAGGLHVCALADNLGMQRAIVPRRAGVLSAEGLVYAPRKREHLQALPEASDDTTLQSLITALQQQGSEELIQEGVPERDIQHQVFVDMCYQGQSSVLQIPWQSAAAEREKRFHAAHEQRFGHRLALPVQQVNIRVQSLATTYPPPQPPLPARTGQANRQAQLPGVDPLVTVYDRETLGAGQTLHGPALISEAVGTTWLAQGWQASVDQSGHLLLDRSDA
jgi:N-methylhydantoinase A